VRAKKVLIPSRGPKLRRGMSHEKCGAIR